MYPLVQHRLFHHLALAIIVAILTLPNLGVSSFWDDDEALNAEAAREMMEKGTWVTPTFNFELRTAKPVMLYWLQRTSYSIFGVNEFAARLPSVLAGLISVLLLYELGRRMFGAGTGFGAAVILASSIEFCMLAHAATPDSTLLMFTLLTLYFFWLGSEPNRRWWFVPTAAASGLAMLTKGIVGVALPGLVVLLYLLWNREVWRVWDKRLVWGIVAATVVAAPWYILVTVDTRGEFAKKFFIHEHFDRLRTPLENHSGPPFYHVAAILVLFAPWSIFLGATVWYAVRSARRGADSEPNPETRAHRFLLSWIICYLMVFSIAATKLPNYVLPLYPALALLTARFLNQWRLGELVLPRWMMPAGVVGLALVGAVTVIGLYIASGAIPISFGKMRLFPGLERWAFLGAIPILGAMIGLWLLYRNQKTALLGTVAATSILFVAGNAAFPAITFDAYKAPRALVQAAHACRPQEEVRLGSFAWFQPSLVFYGKREVHKLQSCEEVADFLKLQLSVYLFIPEAEWNIVLQRKDMPPWRVVAKQYDFLRNLDVVVITNR
jgi:4-amino-4-deoxy-L-arabinose transferase-like glycosyltransferase